MNRKRLLVMVGVAAAAVAAYLAITGLIARRDLQHARVQVAAARSALVKGQTEEARNYVAAAEASASSAARWSGGPVWGVMSAVPVLGGPFDTVRGVSAAAEQVTRDALPGVVTAATTLAPSKINAGKGSLRLQPFATAAPGLASAATAAAQAQQRLDGVPRSTWLAPADRARTQFAGLLAGLRSTLDSASTTARLLPSMLGGNGTRRYLLVFQNEAEMRGLGGLPGAYAIVRAHHGRVTFEHFANDSAMRGAANVSFGREFDAHYGDNAPTSLFVNSDLSPNFPYAAQIWMSMWQRQTGERIDGAIATDPTALSYLLKVTGPTRLADGTTLSANNIVSLTQSTSYSRFLDVPARKAFFLTVARAAAEKIQSASPHQARPLGSALAKAAGERRLLVWSAHPGEEKLLARRTVGGALPQTSSPFTALTINNAAGGKMDYYLDRSLNYQSTTCAGDRRLSTVTVTLTNKAPTHGLPPYVTIRADQHHGRTVPGSDRVLASIYGTSGSIATLTTVDGKVVYASFDRELGHPVWTLDLELNPGQTRTIVMKISEPRTPGPVQTLRQPGVRPLIEHISEPTC